MRSLISTMGKYVARGKGTTPAFILEVMGFFISGLAFLSSMFLSALILLLTLFWAFVVGEAIKYEAIHNGK